MSKLVSLLGLFAAWRAKEIGNASILLWGIGVTLAIAAFVPKLNRVAYLAVVAAGLYPSIAELFRGA